MSDGSHPRNYSRSQHRARAHAEAHDENDQQHDQHVMQHPLVPAGQAELITKQDGLLDLIAHLRDTRLFAYDSEFIGELTYVPKLCLVQVATATRIAIIDPLAGVDLKPFWELLCDPAIEKIVHAGEQDVEPVIRILGREPRNVFDTQIAAGFAALPYPLALGKLVMELVGVRLGKGLTFTHWDQRPLSAMQLRYAADDVRYLVAVHEKLTARINERGHMKWVRAECDELCREERYKFDPTSEYLRIRGSGTLPPRNLAVLRDLMNWREQCAERHDVPPRAFLKDEILLDMARTPIKAVDKLARVKGLPRPVEKDYGQQIVELTTRAMALPPEGLPAQAHYEPSPRERFQADALWATAQAFCAGQGIDPAVVLSRQDISDLSRRLETSGKVEKLRLMRGWRAEALGEPLLRLYRGESSATVKWNNGELQAVAQ